MQNLQLSGFLNFQLQTPKQLKHSLFVSHPEPSIWALTDDDYQTSFTKNGLLNHSANPGQEGSIPVAPIAFTLHCDEPHVFGRNGEIIKIGDTCEHVGDVENEDPTKNGILAASGSPDGCLLAIVSPISIVLLDTNYGLHAEIPCEGIATSAAVSWRSDGEYFSVSRVLEVNDETSSRRKVCGLVANRDCDEVKFMDSDGILAEKCVMDWEPRVGGLIAVASNSKLFFFERNGLRHTRSDFDAGFAVDIASWSRDARILLLYGSSILTFWMKRNGFWYCKRQIPMPDIVGLHWDEDETKLLRIVNAQGRVVQINVDLNLSTPLDLTYGMHLGVVHKQRIVLTNLSAGIVPPPMNHGVIEFDAGIDTVCALSGSTTLGALRCDGLFELFEVERSLGRTKIGYDSSAVDYNSKGVESWRLGEGCVGPTEWPHFRLPLLLERHLLSIVRQATTIEEVDAVCDSIDIFELPEASKQAIHVSSFKATGRVLHVVKSVHSSCALLLLSSKGSLVRLEVDTVQGQCLCRETAQVSLNSENASISEVLASPHSNRVLVVVHETGGALQVVEIASGNAVKVSEECTSFIVHEGFLNFTTASNVFYSLPLSSSKQSITSENKNSSLLSYLDEELIPNGGVSHPKIISPEVGAIRPIDRGSVIVASLPNDPSIILQAPRGNLETIAPRPIVQNMVEKLTNVGLYGRAFQLCRRQRLDMNHIVNVDYKTFLSQISQFVREVSKSDHLSVFMTYLEGTSEKVDTVCQAIVDELRRQNESGEYTSAILTGLVRQSKRDMEEALREVQKAVDRNIVQGNSAVDLLFILTKSETQVYDYALGLYDLRLAKFVAEASQMDPADYSPELLHFGGLDEKKMKYEIDMRLERYDRAMRHLHSQGIETYDECLKMCLRYHLFESGLELFAASKEKVTALLIGYGVHLQESHRYDEAAARFIQVRKFTSAYECYLASGRWQFALDAAQQSEASKEQKHDMCLQVAEQLKEAGLMKQAAIVLSDFLDQHEEAIDVLVEAEEWECAFETAAKANSRACNVEQLRNQVRSGVKEGLDNLLSMITENRTKLKERRARLGVVRAAKEAMRAHVTQREGNDADSDVFTATTTGSTLSNFSDITFVSKSSATSLYKTTESEVGMLSSAKLEKAAQRRKRKQNKKRIRQGHPQEEKALVGYLKQLVPTEFIMERAERCVLALIHIGDLDGVKKIHQEVRGYIDEACALPADIVEEEQEKLQLYLKRIWQGVWRAAV